MLNLRTAVLLTCLVALPGAGLLAQGSEWDASRVGASREDLEELLARFDAVARSDAYSEEIRAEGRSQAAMIRARLERGDFHVGDRVLLSVRDEPELSDTFVVAAGPLLDLPLVGAVSLRGVLRSELQDHMARHISRMINEPVVRARAMIRLSILGEVSEPGFYLFPVEMPLSDAFMEIGGPTQQADLEKSKVERGEGQLLEGEPLHTAIVEGRTLEELHLRTGDRIFVPAQPDDNQSAGSIVTQVLFAAIPAALIASLTRIF